MRLYFANLANAPAKNIFRLRKSGYNTKEIVAPAIPTKGLTKLIVLCDGTPDDIVVGILAYHFDGKDVAGMVKPAEKHLGAFVHLKTYLSDLMGRQAMFRKIMFVIDQEDFRSTSALFDEVENRIRRLGVTLTLAGQNAAFRNYQCSIMGGRTFEISIIVNGLASVSTTKHTIEDHLLTSGSINVRTNSKNTWESLSSDQKELILSGLKNFHVVERYLPQHTDGFRFLVANV